MFQSILARPQALVLILPGWSPWDSLFSHTTWGINHLADETYLFEERHFTLSSGPYLVLNILPWPGELGASLLDAVLVVTEGL